MLSAEKLQAHFDMAVAFPPDLELTAFCKGLNNDVWNKHLGTVVIAIVRSQHLQLDIRGIDFILEVDICEGSVFRKYFAFY